MILRQYREFVEGKKKETRRLVGDHWLQVFYDGGGFEFLNGAELTDFKVEIAQTGALSRICTAERRTLYHAGDDYPLIPKRGQKRLLVYDHLPSGRIYSTDPYDYDWPAKGSWIEFISQEKGADWLKFLKGDGWQEVRVKVEKMEVERLHEITEEGAKREGITEPGFRFQRWPDGKIEGRDCYVAAYEELWDSIHTAKKARFWGGSNPFVVVMTIKPEFV